MNELRTGGEKPCSEVRWPCAGPSWVARPAAASAPAPPPVGLRDLTGSPFTTSASPEQEVNVEVRDRSLQTQWLMSQNRAKMAKEENIGGSVGVSRSPPSFALHPTPLCPVLCPALPLLQSCHQL